MADVITRMIVDSQDYDNKIKRAAQGLQHYADACKKAGGTLEFVDDEAMELRATTEAETVNHGHAAPKTCSPILAWIVDSSSVSSIREQPNDTTAHAAQVASLHAAGSALPRRTQ